MIEISKLEIVGYWRLQWQPKLAILTITFVSSRPVATSHSHTFKTIIHELFENPEVSFVFLSE